MLLLTNKTSKKCLTYFYNFQGNEASSNKNFIRNKVAQIVSLAFIVDYPYRWSSFFTDILSTLNLGHLAVDMYLRILLAIDEEVVDREIVHSPEVCFFLYLYFKFQVTFIFNSFKSIFKASYQFVQF